MIDLLNAKSIVTPRGEVSIIARGSEILWQKQTKKYKTELSNLESTGTQWIDTGFLPTNSSGFDLCGNFSYLSGETRFGTREPVSGNIHSGAFGVMSVGGDRFRVNLGKGHISSTQWEPTEQKRANRIVVDGVSKNAEIYFVDGTFLNHRFSGDDFTTNYSALLFAFNNSGAPLAASSMKVSGCKLYDNGNLVRDYIPVLDCNDRPCMYDKVTDELFYNQGTGEFLYG